MSIQEVILRHKKPLSLIVAAIVLTYAVSLLNGFVGDDHFLFENNGFYKDLKNVSRLVQKNFITGFDDIDNAAMRGSVSMSGCVSYRPVTALSFFIDYAVWKHNPFGHHLTNILIHILACLFIYTLVFWTLKNAKIAVMAAVLFAVHPINAEAVNSIGYRSDLLCLVFYLATFVFFIQYRRCGNCQKWQWLAACYGAFFLSLFSKEGSATLPLLLAVYDWFFLKSYRPKDRRQLMLEYAGFVGLLFFYLYLYFFVFPNSNHPQDYLQSTDFVRQFLIATKIFYSYLIVLIFPPKITILPTLYVPPLAAIRPYEVTAVFVFMLVCFFAAFRSFKKSKIVLFFILWFFITYLPTANLFPVPNPFAFRFMYMPSVGFFVIVAIFIEKLCSRLTQRFGSVHFEYILKFGLVGLCMVITIPHNMLFKNDFTVCQEQIKRYPDCSKPYWAIGEIYLSHGEYKKAIENLSAYLRIDKNNPFVEAMSRDYFVYNRLGMCYVDDPDKAIAEFQTSIRLRPEYALAYANMAKAYILKKDFQKSLAYSLKAIELNDGLVLGYIYAIYSCLMAEDLEKAKGLLEKAVELSPDDEGVQYLKKQIDRYENSRR
ncbi:MAG TPA: hypothetical protein PL155_03780 [Candidatus Omnitrophota bacterium]|nr:hypothetical protein [Candidatus Omnitrophota bacterium]HPD84405.1 hypothetical protein [Candidatus Omnitrophota bacterium]HRZ03263.1 hypothetical protein [Candidatus Omnitrophota bacterium]